MGEVFEAQDERSNRTVALKVLRKDFVDNREALTRFINEARATSMLDHPSLVKVLESGQAPDGTAYIAMEFLPGEPLSQKLRRVHGPLPEAEAVRLAWQMACGLAEAHKKSIVHRDLKPGNVMLVPDPGSGTERAKILDFGIAKMDVRGLDMEDPQTRAGILMGTPYYMSPEQCRGASKVDDKADVYSLGVMMFQMLAGRLPFLPGEDGEGDAAVLAKHVYEPAPSVRSLGPKISEPLDRLVLEMLSKERAQRPTMAVVAARLGMLGGNKGLTGELSMTFEEEFPTRQMPEISTMLPQPQVGQSAAASQPSTLGGGTGQIRRLTLSEAVIKIGKWKTPITVALGMVAGVLLYSGFDAWRRPKPGVDEAVSGAPLPLPQKADTIRTCELWTEPSGVEVRRAESAEKLGVTPWTHRHPASAAPIVLMLKKDGYADRALVLDCERGPVRTEKLEKLAAVTPTVPRVATSPDAPKPGLASAPKKAPTKATSKTVAKRKKPAKRVLKRRR